MHLFVDAMHAKGELVQADGKVDLAATFRNVLRRQAQTFAEQVRWRIHHGSPGLSNIRLNGGVIDFGTFATQSETAPVFVKEEGGYRFGEEHEHVFNRLGEVYRAFQRDAQLDPSRFHAPHLDMEDELDALYGPALSQQLLEATGLSRRQAARAVAERPEEADAFSSAVQFLMNLHDWNANLDVERAEVNASLVDTHALLSELPRLVRMAPENAAAHAESAMAPRLERVPERAEQLVQIIPRKVVETLEAY